jgi:Fe(3+) dicitrate transport protein
MMRALGLAAAMISCTLVAAVPAQAQPRDPSPESESESESEIEIEIEEEEEAYDDEPEDLAPVDVSVFGSAREVQRIAGSAHRVSEEELEQFEDDNVERTLTRVPGVYVRGEDGYGLRPNIGLRGASSDRSKKITLMEDGVLLGPAPYSAPAAYYFPLSTRMVALEVFKGPSAIRYGPNTIGGAVNMVTRHIPYGHKFGADLAMGSELYAKGHGYYGYGGENWGVLLEAVRLRSDGFKELDAPAEFGDSPNTGFDKIEVMGKARVNSDMTAPLYNSVEIKLGYSEETSHETYLGITDDDFKQNSLRRYAASQLGLMEWDRTLIELTHGLVIRDWLSLRTTLYRHDFQRAWRKLNRFDGDAPELSAILADPSGPRGVYYAVLTGARDSTDNERLVVGTNDRSYVSQGIQSSGRLTLPTLGPIEQRVRFGLRLHNDSIERFHTEDRYHMRSGRLVSAGLETVVSTQNSGETTALSAHLVDEIAFYDFMIAPGLRSEYILTDFVDPRTGLQISGVQRVLLPGVGAIYQLVEQFALLVGVHQGFSPVSPGQAPEVEPEVAVNYEGGGRLTSEHVGAELIGFLSDYDNLTAECSFSGGCNNAALDEQYNGGEVLIYGLEASAKVDAPTGVDRLHVPVSLSYTFTDSEFQSGFVSESPILGTVQVGDELPYVPPHQFAVTAGLVLDDKAGVVVGGTFIDSMRELPGQGDAAPSEVTDAHFVLDASAYFYVLDELQLYVKGENLTDTRYIVARRPFGARPGRPLFVFGGVKAEL